MNKKLLSQRHPLFYFLAVWFYRSKRYTQWIIDSKHYSRRYRFERLQFNVKEHSSVLIRKLPEDQMYLQRNKIVNLKIAVSKINGILIFPGETFSFCKLVGLPTRAKGYLEGMEISRGIPKPGIGGGICQISNLLYWLVLHSDLTVIERSHHGYDPFPDHNRILPFGSGATVFFNYIDLQFENQTSSTYQINLRVTEKTLEGELRADTEQVHTYSVYERNGEFIEKEGEHFRKNEIWRKKMVRRGGIFVADELIVKNFARVKYIPEQFKNREIVSN
ncbi:MAG: VanW family protein [Bacteroidota bacterium]